MDINASARAMLGLPIGASMCMHALESQWSWIREDGSPFPRDERPSAMALRGGEAARGAVVGVKSPSGGQYRWLEVGAVPRSEGEGKKPSSVLVTLVDITERKRAQDGLSKKVATLNAINDYSIKLADAGAEGIYALIAESARSIFGASAAADALGDAMGRLQSMNTLYDKLFRAEDLREMSLKEYLPALAREIVSMFPNDDDIEVKTRIDDIRLDVKRLSLIGILVNEIVTNSMKYAFGGRDRGEIRVSAEERKGRVTLRIEDDGVGMPAAIDFESSEGFGLGLIRVLAKQLGAAVAIERRRGTLFVIEFDRS